LFWLAEAISTTDVRGPRVLVVGIDCVPEPARLRALTTPACNQLAAGGADVLALAGLPHYPHWTVPPRHRRRLRVDEAAR
jgi:hypothetical protein